jgi:hypothetical protein
LDGAGTARALAIFDRVLECRSLARIGAKLHDAIRQDGPLLGAHRDAAESPGSEGSEQRDEKFVVHGVSPALQK